MAKIRDEGSGTRMARALDITGVGLTVGTLLSLMVIPVMHALVDDLGQWAARRRARPASREEVAPHVVVGTTGIDH